MSTKAKLSAGSVIVELVDNREHGDDYVLLTVSKFNYKEDAVQIKLPSPVARALGHLLVGDKD